VTLGISCPRTSLDAASSHPQVVYVHDNGSPNQVFAFKFNSDGTLDPVAGSPFATDNSDDDCGAYCETAGFSANKKLLFASGGDGVTVFKAAAGGGLTLVGGGPFGGTRLLGLAVVEKGTKTFVYASDFDGDKIFGFQVQSDSTLAALPGSPFPGGDG